MDYFTKNRLLFWCVILLMLLNLATLTTFWIKRPLPAPLRGPVNRHDGQKIMEERLHLSDEQARQVERIRNEHFVRTDNLLDDMQTIRLDIINEIFASEPNKTKVAQLITELETKQTQFNTCLFRHFAELKQVCTPAQTDELKRMLIKLTENPPPLDTKFRTQGNEGPGSGQMHPPAR
jgi:periplasmic protein CpxP/Spy